LDDAFKEMDKSNDWRLIKNKIINISVIYNVINNLMKINDNNLDVIFFSLEFCDKLKEFKLDTGAFITCASFDDFTDIWKNQNDQGHIELTSAHGITRQHKLYKCSFKICNTLFENVRCADLGKNLIGANLIRIIKIKIIIKA